VAGAREQMLVRPAVRGERERREQEDW
jgi:hypothetical protein